MPKRRRRLNAAWTQGQGACEGLVHEKETNHLGRDKQRSTLNRDSQLRMETTPCSFSSFIIRFKHVFASPPPERPPRWSSTAHTPLSLGACTLRLRRAGPLPKRCRVRCGADAEVHPFCRHSESNSKLFSYSLALSTPERDDEDRGRPTGPPPCLSWFKRR